MVIGETRTAFERDHAFIAPDGHVIGAVPGWEGTTGVILISPHMGARFTMTLIYLTAETTAQPELEDVERFVFVREGAVTVEIDGRETHLTEGGYLYCPPNRPYTLRGLDTGQLIVFDRFYSFLPGIEPPDFVWGQEQETPSTPFMGDENAQLKLLLPTDRPFDMAINLFTFQPGTPLPFVETHVMEHGMMMIAGGGIYRLADKWYPIQENDVLWMGSYCPQWFGCLGRTPATYLYYKDMNRDALSD